MSVHLILQSTSPIREKCCYGTQLVPGDRVYRVDSASSLSQTLFRDQPFCSPRCIRTFCLESLEMLDALDTPRSTMVVSDLHELYQGVAETYAALLS